MSADQPRPRVLSPSEQRGRRAARWRWSIGVVIALGFHAALAAFTRVQVTAQARTDRIDPRVVWVGDKVMLEENTLQGQQFRVLDPAPLFLPTSRNFASIRRASDEALRPRDIFTSFEPILVMPVDQSPPGLVVAPTDRVDPVSAIRGFRWTYLTRFGRADPVPRVFEARQARVEIRSVESGNVVLTESAVLDSGRQPQDPWPDWRPFGLSITVSETGRLSEPVMIGGGSGSDRVDQFMRDLVRRRMRLDLRLRPGNYRIAIGP